jgi:ankyrin repeat protein
MIETKVDKLFKLCREGQLDVSTLASTPHVTKLRDIDNRSLFRVAVEHHRFDTVEYLLQFDVMPRGAESQASIVSAAVKTGLLSFVELMVGRMKFHPEFSGDNLYDLACKLGHLDIMDYIRRTVEHDPRKAFVSACNYGYLDIARTFFLSSEASADDLVYDRSLFTSDLTEAIFDGCFDAKDVQPVFDFLIENDLVNPQSYLFWQGLGRGCATIPFIKYVLSNYSPNERNIHDALVRACRHGRLETLHFLLDWAAKPQSRHESVLETNIVRILEDAFADTSSGDVMEEAVSIVFELLNIERLSSDVSNKLLRAAVSRGYRPIVAALVAHGRCNVNQHASVPLFERTIYRPLISWASDPVVVKLLLDAKAVVDNPDNETVFAAACQELRVDSVKMLLEAKADVNAGRTMPALQHTIRASCTDEQAEDKVAILRLLLEAGADTRRFFRSANALESCIGASESSSRAITAKALLLHDLSLMNWSENGTPLVYACEVEQKDPALFKVLIDAGDDVNACNDKGFSIIALLLATLRGKKWPILHPPRATRESMHVLLDAGADPLFYMNGYTLVMMVLLEPRRIYTDAACNILLTDILEFILRRP